MCVRGRGFGDTRPRSELLDGSVIVIGNVLNLNITLNIQIMQSFLRSHGLLLITCFPYHVFVSLISIFLRVKLKQQVTLSLHS